jgi:hypothetical protein
MKDEKHKRGDQAGTSAKDPARDERKNPRELRLKLALRENLKRRKSQARGRSGVTIAPSDDEEASQDEASGKKPGE